MRAPLLILSFLVSSLLGSASGSEENTFLKNARQLVFDGNRSGEGYYHPDGNALVFQSEREPSNPFYQIYHLDLLSGDTHRVSPGHGKTTCAFFQPQTKRLLFSSTHHDQQTLSKEASENEFRASGKTRRYSWDYDPEYEIYSANIDGTDLKRLTNVPGYDAEASFSPDGKLIVFSSTRGAYPLEKLSPEERARFEKDPAYFADLYVMNADGSGVRQVTHTPGYDGGPFFSPDGSRIVWRRFDASGMNADVYTSLVDGTDVRRITDFSCMSWAPYYHPSQQYIIFTSNKFGFDNFELFIVDAAGLHEPVRVTFTPGFDGLPVFSPDGTKLSWTTNRGGDGKSNIHLADWDHGAAIHAIQSSPLRAGPKNGVAVALPEIRSAELQSKVQWLAAPEREGRRTGTSGAKATATWISDFLKSKGLQAPQQTFLQEFEFPAGVEIKKDHNRLASLGTGKEKTFELDTDFRPLPFSDSGSVEAEVVFAGYGLSVPEGNGTQRYNSYDGLDVKDKVVLLLRYVPEGVEAPRRAQLNRYAGLRYKAMLARERGAKAVLVVSGPASTNPGELLGLSSDNSLAGSGILAHSVNHAVADALLAGTGKSLKEVQTDLDNENPHVPGGFSLPGIKVRLEAGVEHRKGIDHNVIAMIPPGPNSTGEWVLAGAHYDHLGVGAESSSLARSGEEKSVHSGADDNASGTALLMEAGAVLAKEREIHPERFKRGVLLGFWSGEEIGLIGSAAFVDKPPVELGKVVAYINFDMVGRLRENRLSLQGVGSSKSWRKLIERRNVAAGFNLTLQDDPYLPTDTTSFYPRHIPVLSFFTGSHEDYHRPTDTAEKLDYSGLERITRFATTMIQDIAEAPERPDFARVERTAQQESSSRETLRAYLGSIPDYATEVKGVKLSGVRAGSPAEKAGLMGGDIIVEFAGQKVANIYDYTYALDAVKIGKLVSIKVLRGEKTVELSVTPEARK